METRRPCLEFCQSIHLHVSATRVAILYQVERKLTWISFVETYVAIIVSCSPAFFSFWRNHLATTKFFSTLWSRLVSSRSSRSATKGSERGSSGVKYPSSKSPQPLPQNGYFELQESERQQKNFTAIHPPGEHPAPEPGTIIKSIAIDQSSQTREPIQNET